MKLCNLLIDGKTHLGLVTERGVIDASGTGLRMEDVIAGAERAPLEALAADPASPAVERPVFANILERADKIVCVGLNYREHARRAGLPISMTDMIRTPFNLRKMKRAFSDWQKKLEGKAWNALYIENHDHPRIISRYGSERYHDESGKMLAAMYMLQRGTPFIYQGQEIGMTNLRLESVNLYEDVMTHNSARIASKFLPRKLVLRMVQEGCRDSARTPMQWSEHL